MRITADIGPIPKEEVMDQLNKIISSRYFFKSVQLDVLMGNELNPEMTITLKITTFS